MGLDTDAKRPEAPAPQRKLSLSRDELRRIMGLFKEVKTEFPARPELPAGHTGLLC